MIICKRNNNCMENIEFCLDGINYSIEINSYSIIDRYVDCLLVDVTHKNIYRLHGRIEINNHVIEVEFEKPYVSDLYYWESPRNIIVKIDE